MKTRILVPVLVLAVVTVGSLFAFVNNEPLPETAKARPTVESYTPSNTWNEYWYAGKAELNGYSLQQARYGEVHEGKAMLMFVTEDFSTDSHTKASGRGVPVLKVNFDKKFLTGIYPYSMLLTTASPVDIQRRPHPITVTGSVQEWCGHTFTQFNLTGDEYKYTEHSYFPGEGDQMASFPAVWMEDEIWTRIRINPGSLPTGEIKMMPGIFHLRFAHSRPGPQSVTATLAPKSKNTQVYTLSFPRGRTLAIEFEKDFPNRILGWEENSRGLTTKATLLETTRLDYWNKNSNGDRKLRSTLGFQPDEI